MTRSETLRLLRQSASSTVPVVRVRRSRRSSEVRISFQEPEPSDVRRSPTPPRLAGRPDLWAPSSREPKNLVRALQVAATVHEDPPSSRPEPSGIEADPSFGFSPLTKSYSVGGLRKLQFRTGEAETEDGSYRTVVAAGNDPVVRDVLREAGMLPRFRETYLNGLSDKITSPRVPARKRRRNNSKGRKRATVFR